MINPHFEEGIPHPATMTARQRDRRNRLIEAALGMLGSDDYERIQVKDVAEKAGVSLGTLYNYFSSKERLFAEVLVHWADTLPTNIRQRPLQEGRPTQSSSRKRYTVPFVPSNGNRRWLDWFTSFKCRQTPSPGSCSAGCTYRPPMRTCKHSLRSTR